MIHSPKSESFAYLITTIAGALTALFFGVLRLVNGKINNRYFTVFSDAAFSALTCLFMFFTLQKTCGGNVKLFHFAGFITGFLIVNALILQISRRFAPDLF